jgi:hypothetical protein
MSRHERDVGNTLPGNWAVSQTETPEIASLA